MRYKSIEYVLASVLPAVVAFPSFAQEGLEEIVVTATRREANLQQVPISIVAVTGESLEMRGLDSLERVSQAIPNLVITGGGGGTSQHELHRARYPERRHLRRRRVAGRHGRSPDAGIRRHRPHRGAARPAGHRRSAATRPAARSASGRRSRRDTSAPT